MLNSGSGLLYAVQMTKGLSSELIAEFFGTLVLILFGNGVVAMAVLFDKGGYTNITLAWGLAVTMGIYIAGKVTGAHLNPAVTITLAAFRGILVGQGSALLHCSDGGGFRGGGDRVLELPASISRGRSGV